MWFLVLAPMTLFNAMSSLFTLTKGMNFVVAGSGLMHWQRLKGFKAHEGGLTLRENAMPYGVSFNENSDHDLSSHLALLANYAPSAFEPYSDKLYDMTHSEGELLRAIITPAVKGVIEVQSIKEAFLEDLGNEELRDLLLAASSNVGNLLSPVTEFLRQFPKSRTKKANENDSNRRHSWLYRRIRKVAERSRVPTGDGPASPTG